MARNGSGTYSLYTPGNPVVSGTTISSTAFNNTMNDIATALTGSVASNGETPITAPLKFSAGTAAAPSVTQSSDTNTGVYWSAADELSVSTGGNQRLSVDSSGNVNVKSAGARITGDFSNGTAASRVMFQTSTTDGATYLSAIPNGSSSAAGVIAWGGSDTLIASFGTILMNGTALAIGTDKVGTGTYLPMTFSTGGSERLRIDTAGDASMAGTLAMGSAYTLRNKIIGGDFTTNPWQRGTTFTAVADGTYTADRWLVGRAGTAAVVDALKTADAPTASSAGVYTAHCLHLDVTTADASMDAADLFFVAQRIEGFNAASFGFGQSGTRYVTLSFWHKHTKTGTYCVGLRNSAANRSYIAEYTQAVTDTWEKATITIAVDTSGTWLYDSGNGLQVAFTLSAGTNYQTTAGTWFAGNRLASSNQVNALDNTANNFKIALVQIEAGSSATPFEARTVDVELAMCQRYYITSTHGLSAGNASGLGQTVIKFPVSMRATPTFGTTLGGAFITTSSATTAGVDIQLQGLGANAAAVGNGYTWTATIEL